MAKGFSTMQTNVGNAIQDTSAAMATIIGVYINDKYHDVSQRTLWNDLIDWDYTIESVASQPHLSTPADFDKEIAVVDIANGHSLKRTTVAQHFRDRASDYSADVIPDGNPTEYIVDKVNSKIILIPNPLVAETYAVPYQAVVTDLSSTTAPTISEIDWILELGAIGEAWAYKRQFQKASYYLSRYELELRKRIGQEKVRVNQRYQFVGPRFFSGYKRILGNNSYDSIE